MMEISILQAIKLVFVCCFRGIYTTRAKTGYEVYNYRYWAFDLLILFRDYIYIYMYIIYTYTWLKCFF